MEYDIYFFFVAVAVVRDDFRENWTHSVVSSFVEHDDERRQRKKSISQMIGVQNSPENCQIACI